MARAQCNFAVQDDGLAHNSIHHVKLPKVVAREQHLHTLPETIRFLRAALASEWGDAGLSRGRNVGPSRQTVRV